MPKLSLAVPRYRLYRPKHLAVVNFGRGRDVYLGPWKSRRSRELYDQLVSLWLQHGRNLPDEVLARFCTADPNVHVHLDLSKPNAKSAALMPADSDGLTLQELAAQYDAHARVYYRKRGKSTREAEQIAEALAIAVELFGAQPVSQFGPLRFQQVREAMVGKGWSRSYINKQCGRIKRAFRWAVTREMISSDVCGALKMVEGLTKGRTLAPETEDVEPVLRSVVEATLEHLNPVVADMVRLQLETGMRPGEVRCLRPCDVDRSAAVWCYRPQEHKTEHQDKGRTIFIGPRGQSILLPYLLRRETDYCFSPSDAVRKVRERREAERKTPLSCGNRKGTNRKASPACAAGRMYSKDTYVRAIRRACEKANVEISAGLLLLRMHELDAACGQKVRPGGKLGHERVYGSASAKGEQKQVICSTVR